MRHGTILVIATSVAVIIVLNVRRRRKEQNGEWYPTGAEMRRFVDGQWEHRPMTENEADDWSDRTAW